MKYKNLLIRLFLFIPFFSLSQENFKSTNCIYVGYKVAYNSVYGNNNIIIVDTANTKLQNISDNNLFIIDYNSRFLAYNQELKGYLRCVEEFKLLESVNSEEVRNRIKEYVINSCKIW